MHAGDYIKSKIETTNKHVSELCALEKLGIFLNNILIDNQQYFIFKYLLIPNKKDLYYCKILFKF